MDLNLLTTPMFVIDALVDSNNLGGRPDFLFEKLPDFAV